MDLTRPEPRRGLFKLALAAAAGLVGSRLADPSRASAAQGQAVIAGAWNDSTSLTTLRNTATNGSTLEVQQWDGGGTALTASSNIGTAVAATGRYGVSASTGGGQALRGVASGDDGIAAYAYSRRAPGVVGINEETGFKHSTGVIGIAGSESWDLLTGNTGEVGVFGFCDTSEDAAGVVGKSGDGVGAVGVSDNSAGVLGVGAIGVQGDGYFGVYGAGRHGVVGDATPGATGVFGWVGAAAPQAAPAGVAVHAQAEPGYTALNVVGVARFSRSGRTSIAVNKASKVVTMPGVTTASYVIATLQANRSGVFVRAVVCASGQFTIYLNKAVASATDVGFLVIN